MNTPPPPRRLTSAEDVAWLVSQMADETTKRPWIVMSTAAGEKSTRIPWDDVIEDVAGVADCIELVHGDATYAFSNLVGEGNGVWAGAARVYPAGFTSAGDRVPAKARPTSRTGSNERVRQALVSDALSLAHQAGLFQQDNRRLLAVTGTVTAFVASRALIRISKPDALTTLAEETTYPGVPLEWVFGVGQTLPGTFDPDTKRFLATLDTPTPSDLLAHFGDRSVTLGLVTSVERQKGTIALHPGVSFPLTRERLSTNPKDRVDLFLAEGEVVLVRVFRDEQGRPAIRMDDIDDDEIVLPPLVLGNGPWLIEGRDRVSADETVELPATTGPISVLSETESGPPSSTSTSTSTTVTPPVPGPGPRPAGPSAPAPPAEKPALREALEQLATARARVTILERQLQSLGGPQAAELLERLRGERNQAYREVSDLREELIQAKTDLAELRKRSRESRQQARSSDPRTRQTRFAHLSEWFNEEVRRAWLSTYTPQERTRYVLTTTGYELGERFLASLDSLNDTQLRRLFRLVVHVATGRNGEEKIVEVHPLREGDAVTAGPRTREDGSVCLRAYVEEGVPQSRRLHFWKRPDGTIELSRVVAHDDMEP